MHSLLTKIKNWYLRHKKITIPMTIVMVAGAGAAMWYAGFRTTPSVDRIATDTTTKEPEGPKIVPSPLTGVPVPEELASLPVLGVMIENSPAARPQSGLDKAGIVFEAIAEGGITRFLALYQEDMADQIGPVRSVRSYYVDWANSFDASITHVGGSPQGLAKIKREFGAERDFDEFRYGARLVPRVNFRARPHNAYTSTEHMMTIAKETGHTSSDFTPLSRKDASPLETPTAKSITAHFSSPTYRVQWDYDQKGNHYVRTNGGVKHTDRVTKKALVADVAIVMKASYQTVSSAGHQGVTTIGKGQVFVFQDGGAVKGTWRKSSKTGQLTFTDANGDDINLNPGRTWFAVIPTDKSVTYK